MPPYFALAQPLDLFRKMEADFATLSASPSDSWLAFNFFVTAEHLPDWLGKRDLVKKNDLLRVVSHLANGMKHFTVDPERHRSVTGATEEAYVDEGYIEPGYVEDWLLVHLSPAEAGALGGKRAIDVRELGQLVLNFWRPHVPGA